MAMSGLIMIVNQINGNLFFGGSLRYPQIVHVILNNWLVSLLFCLPSIQSTSDDNIEPIRFENEEEKVNEITHHSLKEIRSVHSEWAAMAILIDRLLFICYLTTIIIYHM